MLRSISHSDNQTPTKPNILHCSSPAKINRCLRILNQRPDGYHEIQSLFQRIDCCDHMQFKLLPDTTQIDIQGMPNVALKSNLVYQAAKALQDYAKVTHGVHISIDKHIPMGGGLGGGSSNAATTLKVLNQLWQTQLSFVQLTSLGASLGADVPFFLHDCKAAWVEGIGEQVIPVSLAKQEVILLVFPDQKVTTANVFQHPKLDRSHNPLATPKPQQILDVSQYQENHCTGLVLQLYPVIWDCFQALTQLVSDLGRPSLVQLTGTGSTLFVAFNDADLAQKARQHWLQQNPDTPCLLVQ